MHLYFDDLGWKDHFQDAAQNTQKNPFCEHF